MVMYEDAQLITIDDQDQYHGVVGYSASVINDGVTFLASDTGAITDTANNGGVLRCTSATHNLTTGQYVTLTGMGDAAHVGITRVTVIDPNTFDCDDITYNSDDDTGTWTRGSSLTVDTGHGGLYKISFSASMSSVAVSQIVKIEIYINATETDEIVSERKIATGGDLGALGSLGYAHLTGGDIVWLAIMNKSSGGNFTIEHSNVSIARNC